jgi:hypothetical protein
MALWKIEPTWKKSCVERNHFTKDGKEIIVETGWRWGEFYIRTEGDTPPEFNAGDDIFFTPDAELEDFSTDDGCWEDYDFEGMSEEEIEEVQEFLEENSYLDLEELGWVSGDSEMIITCDVTIEKVED